jgi:hypothetical protein
LARSSAEPSSRRVIEWRLFAIIGGCGNNLQVGVFKAWATHLEAREWRLQVAKELVRWFGTLHLNGEASRDHLRRVAEALNLGA